MGVRLPLSVLLSQALIALTQEFERAGAGTYPVPSLAVWSNLLRLVGDHGVDQQELPRLARLSKRAMRTDVGGAVRSGWVIVESDPADSRRKVVRLTARGRKAREVWRPMFGTVEERWRARFGEDRLNTLRASLQALVGQFDLELPHYPAGYGPADMSITGGDGKDWSPCPRGDGDTVSALPLPALLSQTLVAFAMDYESKTGVALALSANVIRLLGDKGLPVKDLASRAGMPSLPGAAMSALERHRYIVLDADPASARNGLVRLAPRGRHVHDAYERRLGEVEERWQQRYGEQVVHDLRASLEAVVVELDSRLPHYPAR